MQDLKKLARRPGEALGKSWRHQLGRNWAVCLVVFTSIAQVQRQVHAAAASQLTDLIGGGGGGDHPTTQNSRWNPKEQPGAPPMLERHPRTATAEVEEEEEDKVATDEENFRLALKSRAHSSLGSAPKLQIVRLFAPESVQNGANVTIDCMFKYDKKLDQRLTIKWFFNDELEPIYQWIPELNKRVYSDRYERFIDKQYRVSEDVDFMLEAYKKLLARANDEPAHSGGPESTSGGGGESNAIMTRHSHRKDEQTASGADQQTNLVANRRLLANRLNRLAKLGGEHSKHLLGTLRSALAMDRDQDQDDGEQQASQFRALRLIRPTVEMDGRYTCSVSSLDSEDLRSTRLVVYDPPKEFTFNVSKAPSGMYNLTCHAGPTYPQPSLALYRYRAGQLEPAAAQARDSGRHAPVAPRLRLAAATLKQESLAGTRTQLKLSSPLAGGTGDNHLLSGAPPSETIIDLDVETTNQSPAQGDNSIAPAQPLPYEISAWALVDESSLNANLVTQFECVLKIAGANYEQRQTLALEKGWHINSSSALVARTTLVGLMSVLASLLCLAVALASAVLVFKLLREHANKSQRVHQRQVNMQAKGDDGDDVQCGGSSGGASSSSPSVSSRTTTSGALTIEPNTAGLDAASGIQSERSRNEPGPRSPPRHDMDRIASSPAMQSAASIYQQRRWQPADQSDGIYRVPEQRSSFGTRYVIGRGATDEVGDPNGNQHYQNRGFLSNHLNAVGQQRPPPATISVNGKQLYC